MPLTLVTGPANAAKAGVVLGGFREALAAGRAAPTPAAGRRRPAADVEPYQRELAACRRRCSAARSSPSRGCSG